MMGNVLQVRHNIMDISNIGTFEGIKGGMNDGCKDVFFVRAIGTNSTYLEDVKKLDEALLAQMNDGKGFYYRVNLLPKTLITEDIDYYVKSYSEWVESGKKEIRTKITMGNALLTYTLASACSKIEELYKSRNANLSDSMIKNYIVKLLFWFDNLLCSKKHGNNVFVWDEKKSMKVIGVNVEKLQEYLFYYMLTLVGFDVMLLQGSKDISKEEQSLNISVKFIVGELEAVFLPEYIWHETRNNQNTTGMLKLVIPPRNRQTRMATTQQNSTVVPPNNIPVRNIPVNNTPVNNAPGTVNVRNTDNSGGTTDTSEKSFEELALLASSIVMIAIHNDKGEVIGSGSGIMIGREGYILTNNHVTAGGRSYAVRIEDDNNVYETDQMIKYNQFLDLAIIRIDRRLEPIKVYNGGKKLVRGQKVVAIGSPLGLFNSVSDGIISGFRQIDMVDMIQFTAPTSRGSSGGAVLNMQGEVIGISTAGFDAGQNINLAVGYEAINQFIRGFV